jgi:zinc protease
MSETGATENTGSAQTELFGEATSAPKPVRATRARKAAAPSAAAKPARATRSAAPKPAASGAAAKPAARTSAARTSAARTSTARTARSGAAKPAAPKTAVTKTAVTKTAATKAVAEPVTIPAVKPPRAVTLPKVAERVLDNGLRVLVVRRPVVPLVELRLRVPFAGTTKTHNAHATLLGETLLTGTDSRTRQQIAVDVQALGGALSASVDADRLAVSASSLATGLPALLEIVAEVVTEATFPKSEVGGERDRLVQELSMYRSQPSVLAREALLHRLYGKHPYGADLPTAKQLADTARGDLRTLYSERVSPAGATLILVGDLQPAQTLDLVSRTLARWTGKKSKPLPKPPKHHPGPVILVDRPGAVQTNIRMGGPALSRTDPQYAALQLANTVFGGHFTSRLVSNIREDKGYTYSPRSGIEHPLAGSRFTVSADVATEVTGPALLEIFYELGRMCLLPVPSEELESARRYTAGTLALTTATGAGLASTLSMLVGAGIGIEYLKEHPIALSKVTAEDVLAAAATYLAPSQLVSVLVGDASVVTPALSTLRTVEAAGAA